MLPALGHDWVFSADKHTCSRCELEEIHTDVNNDRVCDVCKNELLTSRDVVYLNRAVNETTGTVTTEEVRYTGNAYTILKSDNVWGESEKTTWLILDNDVTLNNRVEVKGNVCIILMNGKTLTANHGITLEADNSLSIFAQSDDESKMGILRITAPDGMTAIGGKNGADGSIGVTVGGSTYLSDGSRGMNCGAVSIFGGIIDLKTTNAVCIGGGNGGKGAKGTIDASFGGNGGDGGSVYFYGGHQTLTTTNASAIGGGNGGDGGFFSEPKRGANGANATVTFYGTPIIKAGNNADTAVEVDGYDGQAYLQVLPRPEYYEFNASSKVFERKSTQTIPTLIESNDDDLILDGGWYIVSGEVTVKSVTFEGNAHIIIANDALFTATNGISAINGANLTFYAQTEDFDHMGKIVVTKADTGNAGIGSKRQGECGDITINGGAFYVMQGGLDAAGIGSGWGGKCGIVTVNGGKVFATGGDFGAGIGSGYKDNEESTCAGVVINGGVIIAVGKDDAEHIGAGLGSSAVEKTIATGLYKYEDFRFACINIELFPEKIASCVDGHKDYFKNCVNGKYYTTDTLEPDSLIENIEEWLAGEGFTGEGDGIHVDTDNDGKCDRCGTFAQVEIYYHITSEPTYCVD